jgi:hypothetical protein
MAIALTRAGNDHIQPQEVTVSDHSILAPSGSAARAVARTLATRGYHARAFFNGKHNVVLAIAPLDIVASVCRHYAVGGF